jgi:hypothetical protein
MYTVLYSYGSLSWERGGGAEYTEDECLLKTCIVYTVCILQGQSNKLDLNIMPLWLLYKCYIFN